MMVAGIDRRKARNKMTAADRGQGLIEFLVALPALILMITLFAVIMAIASLRLEILSLTQELRVCYASTHSESFCRRHFRQALRKIPGKWRWSRVSVDIGKATLELEHSVPFLPHPWKIPL